jgi:hypothetical protein
MLGAVYGALASFLGRSHAEMLIDADHQAKRRKIRRTTGGLLEL